MLGASIDWTLVLVAAVTAVPATLAAVLSAVTRRQLQTSNGQRLGEVVQETAGHAHRADVIVTRAFGEREGDNHYDGTLPPPREPHEDAG